MKNEQKIKDCWDKLVLEYDLKNNQKWFWSNPVVWASEIEQRVSDCRRILDVGCGAGALSIPLSTNFDVTSLDFSLNMLLQLKTRRDELESEAAVEMINADTHNIPFKDDSFDAVICRYAIWPLSDPQCAIEEIARVCRKKVVIIEGDWYKNNGKPTMRQKIFGKPFYKLYNYYYRVTTGRNPNKHFKEMREYHQSSTSAEKITNWLDECGVAIKEVDYSIKERILTKKSRALQWITGYNEGTFILTGEKDADDTR